MSQRLLKALFNNSLSESEESVLNIEINISYPYKYDEIGFVLYPMIKHSVKFGIY